LCISISSGFNEREKLKTQKLLDFEIKGFQDELASFIMDEVMSKKGSFSIILAKEIV
jgi:hypothetical protein